MHRYLITQTLLNSWGYLYNCYDGFEDEALESFLLTLNREPIPDTEAMQAGRNFEKACYEFSLKDENTIKLNLHTGVGQIAQIIKGGQFQVKLQENIDVGEMHFLLYGILDVLKAGQIFDIKYKTKNLGSIDLPGMYLNSAQHNAYLYLVPEAYSFTYLVSDGWDLYKETYTRNDRQLKDMISEFIEYLKIAGLLNVYTEKWVIQ